MPAKVEFVSESTVELSDADEDEIKYFVRVNINWEILHIEERFTNTVRKLINAINNTNGALYWMEPVAVAEGVDENILEEIPSLVDDYRVKCAVNDSQLIIIALSYGPPLGGSIYFAILQAGNWNTNNGNRFLVNSDANTKFSNGTNMAPDMVLSLPAKYSKGKERASVVVVDVEVGNRTLSQIKQDFIRFFRDPALVSVVGIKFFGTPQCPLQRAVAVQWSRTAEGPVVIAIADFGIKPIGHNDAAWFSEVLNDALPGVPADAWTANRYVPITGNMVNGAVTPFSAMAWIDTQDSHVALYDGAAHPKMVFSGMDLTAALHNLPAGATPMQDFVLNLADVLFWVARGATNYK